MPQKRQKNCLPPPNIFLYYFSDRSRRNFPLNLCRRRITMIVRKCAGAFLVGFFLMILAANSIRANAPTTVDVSISIKSSIEVDNGTQRSVVAVPVTDSGTVNKSSDGLKKKGKTMTESRPLGSQSKSRVSDKVKSKSKCTEALYSEGCFTDCLARSVPPDVLLTCMEACGNVQVVTCATCLGVGVYIVWSCYSSCGFSPEAPPEN